MKAWWTRTLTLLVILPLFSTHTPLWRSPKPNRSQSDRVAYFGMNAHLSRLSDYGFDDFIQATDLMTQAGVVWTRIEFSWDRIEPEPHRIPHVYRWSAEDYFDYGSVVQEVSKRNVNILGLLTYGPRTNLLNGQIYNTQGCPPPVDNSAASVAEWLPAWKEYVSAVVSHYGEFIDYWEIQNEPNSVCFWRKVDLGAEFPNATDYVTVLRAAYEIIQELDPNSKVILGGLPPEDRGPGVDYFEYLYQIHREGGWPYFDILAIHPYRGGGFPEQVLKRSLFNVDTLNAQVRRNHYNFTDEILAFKRLTSQFGEKPIWITEMGWPTELLRERAMQRGTQSEIVQSDYLIRMYIQAMASGVDNVMWYDFRDDDVPGNPIESSFGIVYRDFRPKPAYYAYSMLTSLLESSSFDGQIHGQVDRNRPGDDDLYEYRFTNNTETIIVLWKSQGGDVSRTIIVENVPVDSVQVFGPDFTSNTISRTIECINETFSIELTERPVFIVYHVPTLVEIIIGKIEHWFEEQRQKLEVQFNEWWQEQQTKLEDWWEEQTEELIRQIEIEIERQLTQFCGSALLPVIAFVIILRRKTS